MAQEQGTTRQRTPYSAYIDDPTSSDLTIKLRDRTVNVHHIVLRRSSEYFGNFLPGLSVSQKMLCLFATTHDTD